jgi:polyhydroxyalkanoate synthesis regulator phasin
MNQYTDQDFDNMTRDQLVAVFQDMLNEIGLMLEAATTKIREQNNKIDELHQKLRDLGAHS